MHPFDVLTCSWYGTHVGNQVIAHKHSHKLAQVIFLHFTQISGKKFDCSSDQLHKLVYLGSYFIRTQTNPFHKP